MPTLSGAATHAADVAEPPVALTSPEWPRDTRVALVHDYLLTLRGAERTFAAIADIWPQGRIHTSIYSRAGTARRFDGRMITTSMLRHARVDQQNFRRLLPFFPAAFENLRLADSEVVVSSSSAFAHMVQPTLGTPHVSYCHSPFRYAWFERERALAEVPRVARPALGRVLDDIRKRDFAAAARVTGFIANGRITQQRIARFYERHAPIVHPPVETTRFSVGEPGEHLIYVGEVTAHKRTETALRAAELAQRKIVVVGDGPDLPELRERYAGNADFLGRVSDEELEQLLPNAAALILPSVEEFGISAVEAQAAGRPVIAAGYGGALETVVDGVTGLLVESDAPEDFAAAIDRLSRMDLDPALAVASAERFSVAEFQRRMVVAVAEVAGIDLGPRVSLVAG